MAKTRGKGRERDGKGGRMEGRKEGEKDKKRKLKSHLGSNLGCRENVTLFSKFLLWRVYLRQTSPAVSAG